MAAQGYPGAYQNVVRITRYLKEQERLGKPNTGFCTGYLGQPCCRAAREETGEPLRSRDPDTAERPNAIHWVVQRCCSLLERFSEMLRDKERSGEEREARSRLEE